MTRFPHIIFIMIMLSYITPSVSSASDKVIVVTELSPPYQTLNNNVIAGPATEKVRSLLKSKGIEFEIQMYPWARAYKLATTQQNVMIYGMARTDKRDKIFDWLIPVYEFQPYLVGLSNRPDLKITNLEQVKQFTIAVQRNDFSHDFFLSKGFEENKNIILTNSIMDSWRLVKNGKVDFIVEDISYEPTIDGKQIENNIFANYFLLEDLHSIAYLAAPKSLPANLKQKLGIED